MANGRKPYSRYIFNRGLFTMWKGDAAKPNSVFRSIAITSDEFNSTVGTFQVLALEGVGKGIENGKFAGTDGEPRVLFDGDCQGLDAAAHKFNDLVHEADANGFKQITIWDMIEFEEKLKAPQNS